MSADRRQDERSQGSSFVHKLTAYEQREGPRQEVVGSWALKPVGRRDGLWAYLNKLHERRHFVWADSRTRAFSGNRGMILGNLWLVLLPALDGLAYFLIFGLLLNLTRGMDNYVAFLLIGIFMFQFTIRSLNNGAAAITRARNMIRAFSFPRAALPIAIVVREAISMLPVVATMAVLILTLPPRTDVTWHWLLFPLIFTLQGMFNLGIAFLAARIAAHVPDIRHLLSVFGRFWRYGSAVMFPFERLVEDPQLLQVLKLNPLFIIIDMYRSVLLHAEVPSIDSWLTLGAWSFGALVVGFVFFWRAEEQYGRE